MRVQILVRLKPGVLDVQGKAVEKGLRGLGFSEVSKVRIGRLIELDIDAASFEEAKELAQKMCDKLLYNPIIEDYEIKESK